MRPDVEQLRGWCVDGGNHLQPKDAVELLDYVAELEQSLAAYELDGELAAQRNLAQIAELERQARVMREALDGIVSDASLLPVLSGQSREFVLETVGLVRAALKECGEAT